MNPAPTLLIALTLLTLVGSAQDQTVSVPELETLKKEYASLVKTTDGPYLAAVGEVDKNYIARLEQEQKKAQESGKLDDALAIDAEKKAISSGSGVPVGDDAKTQGVLKQMHAKYRAEIAKLEPLRAKNHKPLRDDYAKELDALVMRLTKDGKLQEALTVKKFRDDLPAVSVGGALRTAQPLAFVGIYLHLNGAYCLEILADGTAKHETGIVGKWKVDKGKLIVKWNNGISETIQPPTSKGIVHGQNSAGLKYELELKKRPPLAPSPR